MKFQFKEGQWFDVRNLTEWQKKWCLDNLEFLTLSKSDFAAEHFSFWLYQEWKNLGHYFGSASKPYIHTENEITFNDFYWGEEEEVSQESILDNPRWVTFDASKDLMDCFADKLVDGKDYKVSSVKTTRHGKTYTLENGIRAHEEYFHKVTPQDLLPKEAEDSFDNLVFTQPLVFGASVPLKNLSDEQLMFIVDYFDLEQPSNHKTHFTCLGTTGERYFSSPVDGCSPCYNLSFNQLFQEVD
ncbi:hypothetical protein vBVpaMR16F_231 [Vibrio phage vB_VpaM_R16F]|nr:hypothetical protein vBVpaMR16F_231 [Vibrio phage vB_VpaM_R16F]